MGKFDEELSKTTNLWIKRIGKYLKSRDDMQDNLKKENKSLDECFRYILNEIANEYRKDNERTLFVSGDDEKIYELAIHYYDEDDLKVPKTLNFITNADGSASKKFKKTSVNENKDDIPVKIVSHKKVTQPKKAKKEKVAENQISLFDYLG